MKHAWTTSSFVAVLAVVTVSVAHSQQPPPQPQTPQLGAGQQGPAGAAESGGAQTNTTRTTKEEMERWMTELSNWGRWGKDDQLGGVNLITPQKRKDAAKLVQEGIVVSLAPDMVPGKIGRSMGPGSAFQGPPVGNSTMDVNFNKMDKVEWVWEHNYAVTGTHNGPHFDAICHTAIDGKTYNGYLLAEIATKDGGCSKMGIGTIKDKIVTRGILVDIAAMKGLKQLEKGTHIYKEDLEAFEKWAKVKFQPGDAFLYRVGRTGSGLDPLALPFVKQRDVALFGGDTSHENFMVPGFPVGVHALVMVAMGLNMFDNLDLEKLSETAAALKRWEFMFVATPTPSVRSTGAQISPVAIF